MTLTRTLDLVFFFASRPLPEYLSHSFPGKVLDNVLVLFFRLCPVPPPAGCKLKLSMQKLSLHDSQPSTSNNNQPSKSNNIHPSNNNQPSTSSNSRQSTSNNSQPSSAVSHVLFTCFFCTYQCNGASTITIDYIELAFQLKWAHVFNL